MGTCIMYVANAKDPDLAWRLTVTLKTEAINATGERH